MAEKKKKEERGTLKEGAASPGRPSKKSDVTVVDIYAGHMPNKSEKPTPPVQPRGEVSAADVLSRMNEEERKAYLSKFSDNPPHVGGPRCPHCGGGL